MTPPSKSHHSQVNDGHDIELPPNSPSDATSICSAASDANLKVSDDLNSLSVHDQFYVDLINATSHFLTGINECIYATSPNLSTTASNIEVTMAATEFHKGTNNLTAAEIDLKTLSGQ